jgi:hypothetical protein
VREKNILPAGTQRFESKYLITNPPGLREFESGTQELRKRRGLKYGL